MKRRVAGSNVKGQQEQGLFGTSRMRLLGIGLFIFLGLVLLVRWFSAEPQTTLLTAIARSLIILLPLAFLMLLSRPFFFCITLGFFGAILLNANGFPLSYAGSILWLLGGTAAFLLTLSYLARYIAPPLNLDINRTSYLGFVLLLQRAFRGIFLRRNEDEHAAKNIPRSFETLKAGEVPYYHSYAVYRGLRYTSSLKPGFALLNNADRIQAAFDLRPQIRQESLRVSTRDGIALDTKLRVEFLVRRPNREVQTRLPYPFDESAIHDLMNANTVEVVEREHTIHPYDQVSRRGIAFVTEAIAERTLDDLLQVNTSEGQPLEAVVEEVQERLASHFKGKGLQIRSVSLAPLQLPKEVQQTQLAAWTKSWKDPIANKKLGKGIGRITPEQASAQLQVIEDLMDNLDTFADAETDIAIRDDILAQVRSVITDAAAEGLLQTLIPEPKE